MALDDIQALAMIINSEIFDVPLIVCSDGAVSAPMGGRNLRRLLKYFHREDIQVALGRSLDKAAPPWRSWSEDLNWPKPASLSGRSVTFPHATKSILKTLKSVEGKVIYLCLGPLTNLADAVRLDPSIKEKISRVVFSGSLPTQSQISWNWSRDPESARFVFDSGLNIYTMHISRKESLAFDRQFYEKIKLMDTPAARLVSAVYTKPVIKKLLAEGHFRVWDQMTVIYLSHPWLFRFVPAGGNTHVMFLAHFDREGVQKIYLRLLGHSADFHLSPRQAVILRDIPHNQALLREDVKPYAEKIVKRHGLEEWKACLLTNEVHQHLGIYSIIGAKMGIRAREILQAPVGRLRVVSLAGDKPPLSCMNDGLQVATGATLGRGTIKISSVAPQPAAAFLYGDHKITLKVKKELDARIKAEIKAALKKHGGLNAAYFANIRRLSLDYWYELDRKKIFDESIE